MGRFRERDVQRGLDRRFAPAGTARRQRVSRAEKPAGAAREEDTGVQLFVSHQFRTSQPMGCSTEAAQPLVPNTPLMLRDQNTRHR